MSHRAHERVFPKSEWRAVDGEHFLRVPDRPRPPPSRDECATLPPRAGQKQHQHQQRPANANVVISAAASARHWRSLQQRERQMADEALWQADQRAQLRTGRVGWSRRNPVTAEGRYNVAARVDAPVRPRVFRELGMCIEHL
eukprot:TRINITY_DN7425_c0_g1_i2.p1 TRINITY_DN7425_c0_g1~~TRINITY_DN7425_c0_g1_i2.p1  ORF type:complete len:142 (+),score=17.25 TRINITY_DN7425_c0_g1_i2:161-586(+)